jgi:hypothetical protein
MMRGSAGPFKTDVFDAEDQVTFSDLGTFHLARIEVESLDRACSE